MDSYDKEDVMALELIAWEHLKRVCEAVHPVVKHLRIVNPDATTSYAPGAESLLHHPPPLHLGLPVFVCPFEEYLALAESPADPLSETPSQAALEKPAGAIRRIRNEVRQRLPETL
jgi:hypothetical protein